ncbi:AAA family ATPase [Micromonospora chersina]|uniref:AAA family ATPase n=1 Tax=Micromonospora chersina TaxID=47854 RepID=UPI0033FB742E
MTDTEKRPTPQQGAPMTTTDNGTGIVGNSRILDAALEYAAQGLYVFPVRYGTKGEEKVDFHPLPDWRNGSATNADQIRRWFGPGGSWEGAKLAIDCARSGLVVVDADVTKGRRGPQEWAALDAPATWSVRTPTGGEHWYYREDPVHPIGNDQSGKVAPGVDVRGLGGLVIAPPTVDARGRYAWMEGAPEWSELPTVPRVVVERMTRRAEPAAELTAVPAPASGTYGSTPWTPEQADREINRELDRLATAENGTRNGSLNNAAMRLGHFVPHYLPRETAVALLTERARGIGLDESEILPTINSGLSAGMREPYAVTAPGATDTGQEAEPTGRLRAALLKRSELSKLPVPEPLIADVMHRETIVVLAGKFGSYKSFVTVGMGCSLAAGVPWMGHEVPEAVPVLYVAAEGAYGIRKRVDAWEAAHGPVPDAFYLLPEAARLLVPADVAEMDELIRDLGIKVLIIDTLHASAPGADENNSKEIGPLYDTLRRLRARHGVTTILVHHTGHAGERARGSSSIEDDADTAFVIKLEGDGRDANTQRTLHHRKAKDGALLDPMPLRLTLVPGTDSGYVEPGAVDLLPGSLTVETLLGWLEELAPDGSITGRPMAETLLRDNNRPTGKTVHLAEAVKEYKRKAAARGAG